MDPTLAAEIIRVVDLRFEQLRRQQPRTAYGVVTAVDTVNRKATVQVSGETTASGGFSYPAGRQPPVGALVRVVVDPRGDRYVDDGVDTAPDTITATKLRAVGTGDVELLDDTHPFQVGLSSGQNIAIDGNEIMARNNGAVTDLLVQNDGGDLVLDGVRMRNTGDNGLALDLGVQPLEGVDLRSGSSAGTNYPLGISMMRNTDGSGTGTGAGWPVADGRGTVLTISNGTTLIHQFWMQRGSQGNTCYYRNWRGDTSAWRAWVQVV